MSSENTILPLIIQQRIADITTSVAPKAVGREITLVAVSKTQTADAIKAAFQAGVVHFGENYLQEALSKQSELCDLPLIWHFIGPIQSNKTQLIAEHFDWVESVDREKIARRLSDARIASGKSPLSVLIQVNISKELSKSGVSVEEITPLAQAIVQCDGLILRGLMAIPNPELTENELRQQFRQMKACFNELQHQYVSIDTLSMGMTQDYQIAVEEGATLIRVGTGIFGAREKRQ